MRIASGFGGSFLVIGLVVGLSACGDGGGGGDDAAAPEATIRGNLASASTAAAEPGPRSPFAEIVRELTTFVGTAYAQALGIEGVEVRSGDVVAMSDAEGEFDLEAVPAGDVTLVFRRDDCEAELTLPGVANGATVLLEDVVFDCTAAAPERVSETVDAVVRETPTSPDGDLLVCVDVGGVAEERSVRMANATFDGGTAEDLAAGQALELVGVREGDGTSSALDAQVVGLRGEAAGGACAPGADGSPTPEGDPDGAPTPEATPEGEVDPAESDVPADETPSAESTPIDPDPAATPAGEGTPADPAMPTPDATSGDPLGDDPAGDAAAESGGAAPATGDGTSGTTGVPGDSAAAGDAETGEPTTAAGASPAGDPAIVGATSPATDPGANAASDGAAAGQAPEADPTGDSTVDDPPPATADPAFADPTLDDPLPTTGDPILDGPTSAPPENAFDDPLARGEPAIADPVTSASSVAGAAVPTDAGSPAAPSLDRVLPDPTFIAPTILGPLLDDREREPAS